MKQYLLRNISKYDVNLGDLRYKIPAGKTRNLLGINARLNPAEIEKSRTSGSIKARLGKSLVEVKADVVPSRPHIKLAKNTAIMLPQRTKSYITIEVADIIDEYESVSLSGEDEDNLLKELERDYLTGQNSIAPVVYKDETED